MFLAAALRTAQSSQACLLPSRCLHRRALGEHKSGRGTGREWGDKPVLSAFSGRRGSENLTDDDRQRAIRQLLRSRALERERLQEQCEKTEEAARRLKWVKERLEARSNGTAGATQQQGSDETKKLPHSVNPMEKFGFYEQYEDTEPMGSSTWSKWSPFFVLGLISLVSVDASLSWISSTTPEEYVAALDRYSASVHGIFVEHRFETLVTNAFLHLDETSLVGNLFALWLFGWKFYQVLGFSRFAFFYLTAAATTTALQLAPDVIARVPYLSTKERVDLFIGLRNPNPEAPKPAAEREADLARLRQGSSAVLGGKGVGMAISAGSIFLYPWDRIRVLRLLPMMAMPLPIGVAMFCASEMVGITERGAVFDLVGSGADASGFVCGWLLTLLLWRLHPKFKDRAIPFFNFIRSRPSARTKRAEDNVDLFRGFYHNK